MTRPTAHIPFTPDPKLDLILEREIDVPPSLVWEAWTKPEHVVHWFTPAPWKTKDCHIDLRPGGAFRTTMVSPEGEEFPNAGCYLEVVPERRLVWTDALLPGYRPSPEPFFTGIILIEPKGSGTKYTAMAIHRDEATRNRHAEMGFAEGWGQALDQLVAHAKTMG
jgi:uncharacterized protein YndB with AHSA1/START domain